MKPLTEDAPDIAQRFIALPRWRSSRVALIDHFARMYGVHRSTVYRAIAPFRTHSGGDFVRETLATAKDRVAAEAARRAADRALYYKRRAAEAEAEAAEAERIAAELAEAAQRQHSARTSGVEAAHAAAA